MHFSDYSFLKMLTCVVVTVTTQKNILKNYLKTDIKYIWAQFAIVSSLKKKLITIVIELVTIY